MADRTVGIEIKTTADTSGAKNAQHAIDDLNPGVKRLGNETEITGKNVGKMGMLTNQAGYQVGDFFTQIEMGTPVMRAFSQQAGQMAGALSSAGVLSAKVAMTFAGIGAALPILAIALPKIGDMLFGVAEDADKAGDAIKTMGEKIAKIEITKLDSAKQALAFSLETARSLTEQFPLLEAAQRSAAVAIAKDAGTIAEAQGLIDKLLGAQVDKYKQIEDAANRAAALRKAEFERELADQRKRAEEAFKIQKKAADDLRVIQEDIAKREENAAQKRATLLEMRAQQQQYESALSDSKLGMATSPAGMGELPIAAVSEIPKVQAGLKQAIDEMAASLSETVKNIASKTAAGGELDKASLALQVATKNASDIQVSIESATEKIENSARQGETVAKLETVAQMSEQQAKDTLAVLEKIAPTSTAAQNAVGSLKTMAGDLEITVGENDRFNQQLSNLIGQLQNSNGMADIIREVARIQEQQRQLQPELLKIKAANDRYEQAMKTLNLRK
jgi:hypothetical protein